jgi:hypothetical protein
MKPPSLLVNCCGCIGILLLAGRCQGFVASRGGAGVLTPIRVEEERTRRTLSGGGGSNDATRITITRQKKVLALSALPDATAAATTATSAAANLLMWQQSGSNDAAAPLFLSNDWWTSTTGLVDAFYGTLPAAAPTFSLLLLALHGVAAVSHKFAHPPKGYQTGHEPYARGRYDPEAAIAYYRHHPWLVLRRAVEVWRLSYAFLWSWGLDTYVYKSEPQHRQRHALALVELITRIGPTAIKVGQALYVLPSLCLVP